MPASPIRKLVPYSDAAKKRGIKVYHLNIGQPDIEAPDVAVEAVQNITSKMMEYTHSAGIESYRRKLVGYYESVGINLNLDDILITTGGSESLLFAMSVCLDPGEEVLVPEPFYANYRSFAMQADAVLKGIPTKIENDFALPPIEEFEKYITPKTRAILLSNPGNPTGMLYSEAELKKLAEIVKKHDLYLFSDEVYREFCYDGLSQFSALNLKGLEQNVIMVDSVSKRYSMCGVRLGAFVTRNRDVWSAGLRMAQARLSPPLLAQVAAEAAIDTPQSYFDKVKAEYIARRNCVVEALNKIPGVYCPMPKGAFYAMVKFPVDDTDKFAQWMLEEFSYEGQTTMIAPGSGFYTNPEDGRQQARVAYVLKTEDLEKAVKCLEEGLKKYPGTIR